MTFFRRVFSRVPTKFSFNNPCPTDAATATVVAVGNRFFTGYYTLLVLLLMGFAAGSAFAARPLETDDAGTVDPGAIELELGAAFESDPAADAWETPIGIKTGIISGLDAGLGVGWQRLDDAGLTESGITDLELGAKWNFLSETNALPAVSLTAAVNLPTADEDKGLGSGETDWDVTIVLSKTLADRLTAHLNIGYCFIGSPETEPADDVTHGSAAVEVQIAESWWLTGEMLAEKERSDAADTALLGNAGTRWVVSDNLALDAAVGTALNGGETPDVFATVGLTWLID